MTLKCEGCGTPVDFALRHCPFCGEEWDTWYYHAGSDTEYTDPPPDKYGIEDLSLDELALMESEDEDAGSLDT